MTTPKLIASSKEIADKNYLTGYSTLTSAMFVSVMTAVGLDAMLPDKYSALAFVMALVGFVTTFATGLLKNRKFAKERAEFIASISDGVEQEVGSPMSPKDVMKFLFSGRADDGKGSSLRVIRTTEAVSVFLTK